MKVKVFKGRRLKWWLLSGVVVLLVLLGFRQMRLIEDRAVLLAETGKSVIAFLKTYADNLASADVAVIAGAFSSSYQWEGQEDWVKTLESDRDGIRVYRWEPRRPQGTTPLNIEERMVSLIREADHLSRLKFKLQRLEQANADTVTAMATLWMAGTLQDNTRFENKLFFRIHLVKEGFGWKISEQHLVEGTAVQGSGKGFTDISADTGIDFRSVMNPAFFTTEWQLRRFEIAKYSTGGVSTADYDNDGWFDLLLTQGGPFKLYRNLGTGRFEDVTATAGLPVDLNGVNTAIFADFDNDGYKDLFLALFTAENRVYRNRGNGTFEDKTPENGCSRGLAPVAAVADYDNDGDLDIYLGRYLDPRSKLPTTLFYTRNGEGNSLLRNDGDFHFTDVTDEAGLRDGGLTLGLAWADYDQDGDQDLYVANDFGRNALFRNNGNGTFTDVAHESGALDIGYGMSADWGDVNGDGHLDLYVSNVHSGQRWYSHAPTLVNYLFTSIKQGTILEDWPVLNEIRHYFGNHWHEAGDHIIKGNSLMLGDGKGHFRDVSTVAGANPFGWYWGSAFLDFDNDGRLDIYAGNGFISAKTQDDL